MTAPRSSKVVEVPAALTKVQQPRYGYGEADGERLFQVEPAPDDAVLFQRAPPLSSGGIRLGSDSL